jgi:hypothetical protein
MLWIKSWIGTMAIGNTEPNQQNHLGVLQDLYPCCFGIYIYTGWWFGTWLLFSISYMGWDNPSHWRSPIFQDGYCTTNQIGNSMFGQQLIQDETLMTRSACLTCLCNWTHSWVHLFFCTSIQRNIRTNRTNNRQLPKPLTQLKSSSSEDIYCLNQKQSRDLRCVEAWR